MPVSKKETALDIPELSHEEAVFSIIGESPLILNRLAEKARHELLMPAQKSRAARKGNLKHDPRSEFRSSPYALADEDAPTLLAVMATSFKKAMTTAALEIPGATKASVARLVYVEGEYVGIYGEPRLFMSITRSADINKTPDVRTRAILPQWAAFVPVRFVRPNLTGQSVANLLSAGGVVSGIGDWRVEKGSGSYGRYRLTGEDDPAFLDIVASGGRKAQVDAMQEAAAYDEESAELLSWFDDEVQARGL